MSNANQENSTNNNSYKKPFSVPQLIFGLLLGTYFLTVATIELSLSIYVVQENKPELYGDYLAFKRAAPVWKWWQLFTTLIIPLSVIAMTVDLFQIFTKKATTTRNLLDIVAVLHLSSVLYTVFTRILPLETKLIERPSYNIAHELNLIHWFMFILNIVGWLIPIFRYREWIKDEHFHPKEKTE